MERIEEAEGFDTNEAEQPSGKLRAASGQKRKASTQKFCMLHGHGNHTTDKCKTMCHQAKRMKEAMMETGNQLPKLLKTKPGSGTINLEAKKLPETLLPSFRTRFRRVLPKNGKS